MYSLFKEKYIYENRAGIPLLILETFSFNNTESQNNVKFKIFQLKIDLTPQLEVAGF